MNGLQIFTQFRNLLANLYGDEASARRVAADANMDLRRIAFSNIAINTWQSILIQAITTQRLNALLQLVQQEYQDNQELQDLYQAYRTFMGDSNRSALLTPEQQNSFTAEISSISEPPTPQPLSFFLVALLVEGTIAIGAYDLYLYTASLKAPGAPFLWLSLAIPLIIGIGIGLRANITKQFKKYLWTGLATGLLNSLGVALSLTYYLRGSTPVIDWEKIFYLYLLAPIFCIIIGGIIGTWLQQHIRITPQPTT